MHAVHGGGGSEGNYYLVAYTSMLVYSLYVFCVLYVCSYVSYVCVHMCPICVLCPICVFICVLMSVHMCPYVGP